MLFDILFLCETKTTVSVCRLGFVDAKPKSLVAGFGFSIVIDAGVDALVKSHKKPTAFSDESKLQLQINALRTTLSPFVVLANDAQQTTAF